MDGNCFSSRSEVRLTCPCRLSDGVTLELELQDVSPRGCRVRVDALPLYFGQCLTIFPEGVEPFTGTVRRAVDDYAGIEFDNELPHPVYERIRSHVPLEDRQAAHSETPSPADPAQDNEPAEPVSAANERPTFGSLSSIAVNRRGARTFGTKAVLLR